MPVIKCGNGKYKVEGTPGCSHKTRESAERQLKAIKTNQSKSLLERTIEILKSAKHPVDEDKDKKKKKSFHK